MAMEKGMMRLLLILLAGGILSSQNEPQRHVCLITGGHPHDLAFYSIFQNQGWRVTVNGHPSAFRGTSLKSCDALVLYDMADTDEPERRQQLKDFVESGRGVVILHHALVSNQDWPWWSEQVVGGLYRLKPSGESPASTYKYGVSLPIQNVGPRHPVTAGVDHFEIVDEAYNHVWHAPGITVLLETKSPENQKPIAWLSPTAKFRVVYLQLGHGPEVHVHPIYQRLVRNAVHWALLGQ
jgi:type 1 glutamine amidotransferase